MTVSAAFNMSVTEIRSQQINAVFIGCFVCFNKISSWRSPQVLWRRRYTSWLSSTFSHTMTLRKKLHMLPKLWNMGWVLRLALRSPPTVRLAAQLCAAVNTTRQKLPRRGPVDWKPFFLTTTSFLMTLITWRDWSPQPVVECLCHLKTAFIIIIALSDTVTVVTDFVCGFPWKVFFFFTLEMRVAVYFIICVTSSKSCLFIFLFPGGGRDLDSEPGAVLQTILRVHVQHLIVNIIFQSSQLVSPCHRSVRCHAHAHTDTHVSLLPHLSVGQSPIVKTKPPLLSISLLHYPDSTCEPLSLNLVPGILPVVFFLKKQTNK